jgi:hypothetical protein
MLEALRDYVKRQEEALGHRGNERGRPTGATFRHVAGGSMSGARGVE